MGRLHRIGVGGMLVQSGKVLLGKRSPERRYYPNVWDVIGGHLEGTETTGETLVRELIEEIGVRPTDFHLVVTLAEPRPAEFGPCDLYVFAVTRWLGEIRMLGSEHSELRWVSLAEARTLDLAHPDYGCVIGEILGGKDT